MKNQPQTPFKTYRRRVLCLTLGILTQSVTFAPLMAAAQPPAEEQAKAASDAAVKAKAVEAAKAQTGAAGLRVVPIQRKNNQGTAKPATGKQTGKPGGITITPDGKVTPNTGNANPSINTRSVPEGQTPPPQNPANAAPPLNNFKAGNSTPFSFSFNGSEIINVLKFFSQMSGLNISAADGLAGQVTIINPKPVSLDEAFKILQSVLNVRGFTALQNGNTLMILPLDRAVTQTTLISPGLDEDGNIKGDPRNQVMTQVIPLDNVDAEALSKELLPLISKGASLIGSPGTNSLIMTDTSNNIQRFVQLVDALDKTSNNTELMVYPLRYAEAATIADIITNLYKQTTTRGRGGGAAQQPGMPPPQPGQPGAAGGGRPAVLAVADPRTNQVLVIASAANQASIARDIISRLDDDGTNTIDTDVRKIKYADATQVANQVNQVLSNLRPGGAAGGANSSFQQRTFGGGFNQFGGGGGTDQQTVNSTDPFGKVVADARTNNVIITASEDRRRKINELIDTFDVDVPVESTTFVIPLKNAQADDVAYALQQAFSTGQQQGGGFGGFFGGFGGQQQQSRNQGRTPINRRLGSQSTTRSRGARIPPGPPNAPGQGNNGNYQGNGGGSAVPQGVQGVMTPDGQFVPTEGDGEEERTRQFFDFFGGNRQSRLGQAGGAQFGRGQSGSFVNLLRLQNNVFVTPSPYGDSLIVTTTPDNYKTILGLIQQLDVIQPQVMIEVIIAEVTLDANERLGFSLAGRFANLFGRVNTAQGQVNLPTSGGSNTFDATAGGTQFTIAGTNYSALLQALASDSKVRVISTPRIFTSNNQEAFIDISTKIPYVDSQNITPGVTGNIVSNVIETADVGFQLTVTPRIARQGLVTIDVLQVATDLLRFDTFGSGVTANRVPVINNREADTSVTVMDNETIVIGGLIRESNGTIINKIPIISEIPLIGQFFRNREKTKNKVELMIFMTPHVVRSVEEARELTRRQGAYLVPSLPNIREKIPLLDSIDPKTGLPKQDGSKPNDPNRMTPNGSGNGTGTPQTPPPGGESSSVKNK